MKNSLEKGPSENKEVTKRKIVGITPEIDKILQKGISPEKILEELNKNVPQKWRKDALRAIQLERQLLDLGVYIGTREVSFWELYQFIKELPSLSEERKKYIAEHIMENPRIRQNYEILKQTIKPDLDIARREE